jgi:hypothetical protein
MRVIVTGMIATYPVGGVLWDYAQYALGFERLGCEVYYLEDTGCETYDPVRGLYGEDCSFGVNFLKNELEGISPQLARRWHFRAMDGKSYGISPGDMDSLVADADLFLNVSGSCLLREAYMRNKRKVLIDTDPGWNHFVNYSKWDKSPGWQGTRGYRRHDYFFTYAGNIGGDDCLLPSMGLEWKTTRPLVIMDAWHPRPPADKWTTVMSWNNFRDPVEYQGKVYGSKEMEFCKVKSLPGRVSSPLEIAVGGDAPREEWIKEGWSVIDSHAISRSAKDYRDYIQSSRGEFSVAKNVYAATRSGWFSCRSICYMAAGRPVVVQDTGFSKFIPTGEGVIAFSGLDEAVKGIEEMEKNYARHCGAARDIVGKYFGSDAVLNQMLKEVGLG